MFNKIIENINMLIYSIWKKYINNKYLRLNISDTFKISGVITGAVLKNQNRLPLYCLPGIEHLYRSEKKNIYDFKMILKMKDFVMTRC